MLRNLLAGLLIGIGCILPGVSGGVMAVSFGLYRPMLDAAAGFFNNPKQHLRFLFPLGLSISAGIALGAFGLAGAMTRYGEWMLFLFTGFILGGIPDLIREAEQKERFRLRWLLALPVGALPMLPIFLFSSGGANVGVLSPVQAFLTGLLEGVGTVIPGVSTSLVLIHLGWYQAYLTAVSTLNPAAGVWIAAGFGLSALLCIFLVRWLYDRYQGWACYAVLGFLLVSVALVFPGFGSGKALIAEMGMLCAGIGCVRLTGRLET